MCVAHGQLANLNVKSVIVCSPSPENVMKDSKHDLISMEREKAVLEVNDFRSCSDPYKGGVISTNLSLSPL